MVATLRIFADADILKMMGSKGYTAFNNDAIEFDAKQMMNGIIKRAEKYCDRIFTYSSLDTEEAYSVGNRIFLRRFPIESITSVKAMIPGSSSAVETSYVPALPNLSLPGYTLETGQTIAGHTLETVDSTVYEIFEEEGSLKYLNGDWPYQRYYITYSGGFGDYLATDTSVTNELPDDLANALLEQFRFEWAQRDKRGVSSASVDGSTVNKFQSFTWLPSVKETLIGFRRVAI